jgi:hypothetical protein
MKYVLLTQNYFGISSLYGNFITMHISRESHTLEVMHTCTPECVIPRKPGAILIKFYIILKLEDNQNTYTYNRICTEV